MTKQMNDAMFREQKLCLTLTNHRVSDILMISEPYVHLNRKPKMTRTLNRSILALATLALVSSLAACGGGGGDSTATASSGGAGGGSTVVSTGSVCTTCIPVAGTLQVTAGPSTYAAGSVADSAYNALNVARIAAGAGAVSTSSLLDSAATFHATYVIANISSGGYSHYEDRTKPNFYGRGIGDRLAKAGYSPSNWGEVIGGNGTNGTGADFTHALLNTVYHGMVMLSQNTEVGFGAIAPNPPSYLIVANFGTPASAPDAQIPGSGAMVAYPFPGQTDVLSFFDLDSEMPRMPLTLFPNQNVGAPVLVNIRNADFVNANVAGTGRHHLHTEGRRRELGACDHRVALGHRGWRGRGAERGCAIGQPRRNRGPRAAVAAGARPGLHGLVRCHADGGWCAGHEDLELHHERDEVISRTTKARQLAGLFHVRSWRRWGRPLAQAASSTRPRILSASAWLTLSWLQSCSRPCESAGATFAAVRRL